MLALKMKITELYYPAVFYRERKLFRASFPDIRCKQILGRTLAEAYKNAEKALELQLNELLSQGKNLSQPTNIFEIATTDDAFVLMIKVSIIERRKHIRKTFVRPFHVDFI